MPAQYFEHDLLLCKDFSPLDVDLNGLSLACCWYSRLLKHSCNGGVKHLKVFSSFQRNSASLLELII